MFHDRIAKSLLLLNHRILLANLPVLLPKHRDSLGEGSAKMHFYVSEFRKLTLVGLDGGMTKFAGGIVLRSVATDVYADRHIRHLTGAPIETLGCKQPRHID